MKMVISSDIKYHTTPLKNTTTADILAYPSSMEFSTPSEDINEKNDKPSKIIEAHTNFGKAFSFRLMAQRPQSTEQSQQPGTQVSA